jgi:hypothetical protein
MAADDVVPRQPQTPASARALDLPSLYADAPSPNRFLSGAAEDWPRAVQYAKALDEILSPSSTFSRDATLHANPTSPAGLLPAASSGQFRDPLPPQGNAMAQALMGKTPYGPATGLRVPGNMNMALSARPQVRNPDGSVSTVRTLSFGTDEGEVVVPTVSDDGRIMSDEEAIQNYYRTGKHMGIFSDPDSATAYARMLHDGHEWLMNKNK